MDWTRTRDKGVITEYYRIYFKRLGIKALYSFFEKYNELIIFWVKVEYHRNDYRKRYEKGSLVQNLVEFFGKKETGKILVSVTMRYGEIWNDFIKEVVPDINERKSELARGKR